ncbi:MAG: HAMP domain-containing sensor histidine kinase [Candidatus Moraniibacteriota bacterium]
MPIFVAFLAYSIVKYQILDIKTLAVQVLVAAITILVGAQFFFVRTPLNRSLTLLTLVCILVFGYMLIQSVKREIQRKEELQKMADSLARANERLKDLDNTKSEFISIASHQLRTPLTAIKGYISLLLEGSYGKVPPNIQDVMNKLYSVNDRLIQLVEDLLNVSRIEAGRIQYNFEETQLEPLVADLIDGFKVAAKDKKLTLKLELPEHGLPKLLVDPNKLKEVLSNLIDNAIKYTKEGSVAILLQQSGPAIRIQVQDTGIGMAPENKAHLFEKFVRSKETSRMVVGGAGLGLFVGKSFVQAMGGRIWAESEGPGKGSTFIVELPLVNTTSKAGKIEKPK